MKEFHILAIDGGGSKGLMEALIIQDVMRAATFIMQNPTKVLEIMKKECPNPSEQKYSYVFDYGSIGTRQKFIDEMLKIEEGKLIHPTEVFDMICGTSVGALMAFGIVGGKKDDLNGERVVMSMQEVVDFMVNTTNKIWPASGKCTAFWNTIKSCAFRLYSSDLKLLLKKPLVMLASPHSRTNALLQQLPEDWLPKTLMKMNASIV